MLRRRKRNEDDPSTDYTNTLLEKSVKSVDGFGSYFHNSPEESRMRTRPVNLDVTIRAARILRILIVRWTSRLVGSDAVVHAVARQTELVYTAEFQESRIR